MIRRKSIFSREIVYLSLRFRTSSNSSSHPPLKNFLKPDEIELEYWKKLLWVALDLKSVFQKNGKKSLTLLDSKHVTLLFSHPHEVSHISFSLACDLLGARRTYCLDDHFGFLEKVEDTGKAMSRLTDMLVICGFSQRMLIKLAESMTVPLFPIFCNLHSLQQGLSDFLSVLEKFQRLRGLTMAYIGPPVSTFNTYLTLCALFGIHLRYFCLCKYGSGEMSPVRHGLDWKKCKNIIECIEGCSIIATTRYNFKGHEIHLKDLSHADKDWVFLHELPRGDTEAPDEVFQLPNNLAWTSTENFLYIAMAVILTSLQDYQPTIKMPNFGSNS